MEVSALIVLVVSLSLLSLGSRVIWKVVNFATRPVPSESRAQVLWLVLIAGGVGCGALLSGICIAFRLAGVLLELVPTA